MTKRTLRKRLKEAKALIEDPKHWTQGEAARDKWGHAVSPTSQSAERFCAIGACEAKNVSYRPLTTCLGLPVAMVNDGNTGLSRRESYEAILDAFDRAIEKAK